MSRYTFLLNVLDALRREAVGHKHAGKYVGDDSHEGLNQARSRAYIHLFLKVRFGLLDFATREHYVTDGAYDGGVDGYYLSEESKAIYAIQSKFRTTETNFAEKQISLDEILVMDVDRISRGELQDGKGNAYNGKILQLEREISQIPDIARWKYHVIILANLKDYSEEYLKRLTGGFPATVYGSEECYSTLLFPIISGTYYSAAELRVHLDLSNKYSGTKISYTVATEVTECEITVVFVPVAEIATILHKYKNSILRFNPRSYLEFEGKKVNRAIRQTVIGTSTNEFALFNNGITMMSDATDLNERIGQRNKAQLTLMNPQIINGGQTAYTLSRLHEELQPEEREKAFSGKEVLLKVITLIGQEGEIISPKDKADLIARISSATNQQTTVINADKFSNDHVFVEIQAVLFRRYSLLFERKRGEFADGIHKGYVTLDQTIERNLLFRLFLAVQGDFKGATQKRLFMRFNGAERIIENIPVLDRVAFAFWLHKAHPKRTKERDRQVYAKIYVLANRDIPAAVSDWESASKQILAAFEAEWEAFIEKSKVTKRAFWRNVVDPKSGKTITAFSAAKWEQSSQFVTDVQSYFHSPAYPPPKPPYVESSYYDSSEFIEKRERERLAYKDRHLIAVKESETDLTQATTEVNRNTRE